ncbi:MAG: M81 family metallopeptidase [Candidatus Puniceispirillales bacterium]
MTRIIAAGFQHETNTFAATKATLEEFELWDSWPGLLKGDDVRPGLQGTTIPLAGFIAAVDEHNAQHPAEEITLIPLCWASAEPASFVTDEAFETIAAIILDGIAAAGDIDGIYLDLHGAMVTESHADGEGELLSRIRRLVGDECPVVVSLDLHANLTRQMVDLASAITVFRTYPHLDMAETGARALPVLLHLLGGGVCHAAWRQLPYLIPLQAQFTGEEPIRGLYDDVASLGETPPCWAEFAAGFPASDIADAGPAFLAYAETPEKAEAMIARLSKKAVAAEPAFKAGLLDPDEAVAAAMEAHAASGKPVVIADVQDNPGAGGTSDTTGLIEALIRAEASAAIVGMVHDPHLAAMAHAAGEGAVIDGHLGGRGGGKPVAGPFRVGTISNGNFPFGGAMYRGCVADAGPSAVITPVHDKADITIVVSSKRCQNLDQAIFTHLGINPAEAAIIVVKSTVHFRADYEPLGGAVINAYAPGLHPCRLDEVEFRHLRPGVRRMPGGKPHGR